MLLHKMHWRGKRIVLNQHAALVMERVCLVFDRWIELLGTKLKISLVISVPSSCNCVLLTAKLPLRRSSPRTLKMSCASIGEMIFLANNNCTTDCHSDSFSTFTSAKGMLDGHSFSGKKFEYGSRKKEHMSESSHISGIMDPETSAGARPGSSSWALNGNAVRHSSAPP